MRIEELNARDDDRVRRLIGIVSGVLAAPVGFAFGFASFGSALWANIYVDGHDEASFSDVFGAIAPSMLFFGLPAIVLAVVAARLGYRATRWIIGAAALVPMTIAAHYTLCAVTLGAAVSSLWRSLRSGGRRPPAFDATVLLAGLALTVLWCALEAGR